MSGEYNYVRSAELREQRQRERLCSAFVQALSESGYEEATIARVAELSGCSPETFHRYYEDLADLFCDACSHTLQESRSAMVTAWLTVHGWSERLRRSCEALLAHVEEQADAARAVLVTSLAGGPEVADHVRETVAFHERALVMAFQLHPQGFPTSRLTPRALIGGMRHVIYMRMREGGEGRLSPLADDLHEWIECHRSGAAALLPLTQRPLRARRLSPADHAHPLRARCDRQAAAFGREGERARVHETLARLMLQESRDSLDDETVARFAGISAARFRADYGGVSHCLAGLLDGHLDRVGAALAAGSRRGRDWPQSVRLALAECMRQLAAERQLTRLALLRLSLVRDVAEARHAALPQRIVSFALERAPEPRHGAALIPDALVGAVGELLSFTVAAGAFARLPALADHIAFFLLAPHLGGEEAARAVIASADVERLGSGRGPGLP